MMKPTLFISIIFVAFFSCDKNDEKNVQQLCAGYDLVIGNYNSQDDNAIFNVVAREFYDDNSYIHVIQETDGFPDVNGLESVLDVRQVIVDSTVISNYELNNQSTSYYSDSPNRNNIHLMTYDEYLCIFSENRTWFDFLNKYPESNGVITFTKPGISDDGLTAVVVYTRVSGLSNGMGDFYGSVVILEKIKGEWQIIEDLVYIVS